MSRQSDALRQNRRGHREQRWSVSRMVRSDHCSLRWAGHLFSAARITRPKNRWFHTRAHLPSRVSSWSDLQNPAKARVVVVSTPGSTEHHPTHTRISTAKARGAGRRNRKVIGPRCQRRRSLLCGLRSSSGMAFAKSRGRSASGTAPCSRSRDKCARTRVPPFELSTIGHICARILQAPFAWGVQCRLWRFAATATAWPPE